MSVDNPLFVGQKGPQTLGDLIASKRTAKGLTQAQLGQQLGVSGGAVGNWERGQPIAEDNLPSIIQVLEIDGSDLTPEMLSQVGRKSRRPLLPRGETTRQLHIPLKGATVTSEKTHAMRHKPGASRTVLEAQVNLSAERVPKRANEWMHSFRRALYEGLEKLLPEFSDNVNVTIAINNNMYRFDYYSDRLVVCVDLNAFRELLPGHRDNAALKQSINVQILWRLAFTKRIWSDDRTYILVTKASEELISSALFQRRLIECGTMGIVLMLVNDFEDLAETIRLREENKGIGLEEEDDLNDFAE